MSRAPIRLRLTAWYCALLAALLGALGVFVTSRLRADLTAQVDRSLTVAAAQISRSYATEGAAELVEASREFLGGNDAHAAGAQVLDARATVLVSGGASMLRAPLIPQAAVDTVLARNQPWVGSVHPNSDVRLRTIAMPVERAGTRRVVVVADSLHDVDEAVGRVATLMLIGGLTALALAGLGGWWIARRGLRPVEQMATQAGGIDVAALAQRVPVPPASDELRHLALTLNEMLARLERGVVAREQLIADASHELRGPLAAMRAELEVSLRVHGADDQPRSVVAGTLEEVVRMSRLVDNMLTLARVDDGRLELLIRRIDLSEVARTGAQPFAAAAAAAGVTLEVVDGDPQPVDGDRDRLVQVVSNLVDNAVRNAPPRSAVRVATSGSDEWALLTVTDTGPGIPPELREEIFDRFVQADTSRSARDGAGLGLAICQEIARAHGGTIRVNEPSAGIGAELCVRLPRQRSPTTD